MSVSSGASTGPQRSEIFDIVFEALDFPERESALMVGDNLSSDIEGGANYGIATCWYNPHRKPIREPNGVDHEIVSLDQLLELATTGA